MRVPNSRLVQAKSLSLTRKNPENPNPARLIKVAVLPVLVLLADIIL
jgi:hypothetical protein